MHLQETTWSRAARAASGMLVLQVNSLCHSTSPCVWQSFEPSDLSKFLTTKLESNNNSLMKSIQDKGNRAVLQQLSYRLACLHPILECVFQGPPALCFWSNFLLICILGGNIDGSTTLVPATCLAPGFGLAQPWQLNTFLLLSLWICYQINKNKTKLEINTHRVKSIQSAGHHAWHIIAPSGVDEAPFGWCWG